MDVEDLFRKHTLVELKEVEKKLRTDVERKKEELRDLVSKRYRDLLDAADQIKGMHVAIENVTTQLKVCRTADCASTRQLRVGNRALQVDSSSRSSADVEAFLDRLLPLLPEFIFQALDRNDPLSGAVFFAVVRNLVWQLNAENPEYVEDPHWNFIRVYPDFISQNILTQFERITYDDKDLPGYFAAAAVLNSAVTKLDSLHSFLAARTDTIRHLLTASSTLSTKETLRLTLICILETLRRFHELFVEVDEFGDCLRKARSIVTSNILNHGFQESSLSRIFDEIVSFPYQHDEAETDQAKMTLASWLDKTVAAEFALHLATILHYVPSIQAISEVSRTVAAAVAEENFKTPSLTKVEQDLGLSMATVVSLLHDAVRLRFCSLVEERTSRVLKEISKQLDGDAGIPNSAAPVGGKFVSSLKGAGMMTDRSPARINVRGSKPHGKGSDLVLHPGVSYVSSEMASLRQEITQTRTAKDDATIEWMQEDALKAFSAMITALRPLLQTRFQTTHSIAKHQAIYAFMSQIASQNVFTPAEAVPELADFVHRQLDSCISLVFSDWLFKMLEKWKISALQALEKDLDVAKWSLQTTPFQKNTVEELNEFGQTVQYTVVVPCRASVTCHKLLQSLHQALTTFTAGSQVSPVNDAAVRQIFITIAQCYIDLLQADLPSEITKNQALQLIFDLKVILTFGKRRKAWPPGTTQTLQKLVDKTASCVDQIDYHGLLPLLDKNVQLFISSVQNLFFILTFVEASGATVPVSVMASQNSNSLHTNGDPLLLHSKAVWFSPVSLNSTATQK